MQTVLCIFLSRDSVLIQEPSPSEKSGPSWPVTCKQPLLSLRKDKNRFQIQVIRPRPQVKVPPCTFPGKLRLTPVPLVREGPVIGVDWFAGSHLGAPSYAALV